MVDVQEHAHFVLGIKRSGKNTKIEQVHGRVLEQSTAMNSNRLWQETAGADPDKKHLTLLAYASMLRHWNRRHAQHATFSGPFLDKVDEVLF